MDRLSLREAAEHAGRSLTTLRRYIRSGRLHAEKLTGRFGPEYFVTEQDLAAAGLELHPGAQTASAALVVAGAGPLDRVLRESVPLPLYQELQMKHEHLLVQYGMVRMSGLRVLDLQAELETRGREIEEARSDVTRQRERYGREISLLRKQLREAALELEGRRLEIEALREKVRGLEMLTRNTVTSETIERQYARVMEQVRLVDRLGEKPAEEPASWPVRERGLEPEH